MSGYLNLEDVFTNTEHLSQVIIELALPDEPLIDRLISFDEEGMTTTKYSLDFEGEIVQFVPAAPRGAPPHTLQMGQRGTQFIPSAHLPINGSVLADEFQDVRASGSLDLESAAGVRDKKLRAMKKSLVYSRAHLKFGAIKGVIVDAVGTEIFDIHASRRTVQKTHNLALDVDGTDVQNAVIAAQRKSQDGLGALSAVAWVVLASPELMDNLRGHPDYKGRIQFAAPAKLLAGIQTGIQVGDTTFIEFRQPAGSPMAITAGEGYMVPLDIGDLFIGRYAPPPWIELNNMMGQPMYARAEAMPMGRGYALEACIEPAFLCTRPDAIIKLTSTNA